MFGVVGAGEVLLVIAQAIREVQALEQILTELHKGTGVFGAFFQIRVAGKLEHRTVIVVVQTGGDIHETGVEGVLGRSRGAFGDAGIDHSGGRCGQRVLAGFQLGFIVGNGDFGFQKPLPVRRLYPSTVFWRVRS